MSRRRLGVLLAIALALVLASPAGVAGTQADDWPDDTYEEVPRGSHSGVVSPADDTDRFRVPVSVNEVINVSVSTEAGDEVEARFEYPGGSATLTDDGAGERRRIGIAGDGHVSVTVSGTAGANWTVSVARERSANPTSTPTPDPTPGDAATPTPTPTPSGSPTPTPTQSPVPDGTVTPATTPTEGTGGSSSGGGGGGGGGGQPGADAAGEVEIADRTLLNGSATTGTAVVARVDLVNYDPVRGTLSLTLTADGSTVAERSVAVAASSERTVLLRHAFDRPGGYELAVNGATVGTVAVAEPATVTPAPTSTPAPTATPTPPTGTSTVGSTGTADGAATRTAPGTAEDRSATAGDGVGFGVPVALLALLVLGALRRRD